MRPSLYRVHYPWLYPFGIHDGDKEHDKASDKAKARMRFVLIFIMVFMRSSLAILGEAGRHQHQGSVGRAR